jgi:hypothetical protein
MHGATIKKNDKNKKIMIYFLYATLFNKVLSMGKKIQIHDGLNMLLYAKGSKKMISFEVCKNVCI